MSAPSIGQSNDDCGVMSITLTTTKTIGNPDKISGLIGVYQKSGVNTDKVPFKFEGKVFTAAKATGSWVVGQKLYHHATTTNFSTAATNGTLAGFAAEAKATAVATGWVRLCPVSA